METLKNIDSPETLEEVESVIKDDLEQKATVPLNRAQRRALAKKAGKRGRMELGTISETAKKLSYIHLIENLRKITEKEEQEEK